MVNSLERRKVTGWIYFAQETQMASSCENGNEPSGSIQFKEFLKYLTNYQLLNEYAAPCR
jgi:hypothetical protein